MKIIVTGMEKADEIRQRIADIISGKSKADFIKVDEAIELWASLPKERHGEIEGVINNFANSIEGSKPVNHGEWWLIFYRSQDGSYEKQIAILMMARTAKNFPDWIINWMSAEGYPLALKKIIARGMMDTAKTKRQIEEAKAAAREAGIDEEIGSTIKEDK